MRTDSILLKDSRAEEFVDAANLAYSTLGFDRQRKQLFINAIVKGLLIYEQEGKLDEMVFPRCSPLSTADERNLKKTIFKTLLKGNNLGRVIKYRLGRSVEMELHRLAAMVYVLEGNLPSTYTLGCSFGVLRHLNNTCVVRIIQNQDKVPIRRVTYNVNPEVSADSIEPTNVTTNEQKDQIQGQVRGMFSTVLSRSFFNQDRISIKNLVHPRSSEDDLSKLTFTFDQ